MSDEGFISRWSRKKSESKAAPVEPVERPKPMNEARAAEPIPPVPLPPIESLTPESDFTPFMQADVSPALRRQAVKTLFQDPRYNVMDGLDTYIADYSKPDPLPAGWLEKMTQTARLGVYREPEPEPAPPEAAAVAQGPLEHSHDPADTPAEGSQAPAMPKSTHQAGADEDSSGVDFPHNKAANAGTPND
jgi:hypothetical protein